MQSPMSLSVVQLKSPWPGNASVSAQSRHSLLCVGVVHIAYVMGSHLHTQLIQNHTWKRTQRAEA